MLQFPFTQLKKDYSFNKKVLGFDIETHGDKNEFVLACLQGYDEQHVFYTQKALIDFLNNLNHKEYILVSTHLGFDFLGSFMNQNINFGIQERNGIIYKCTFYRHNDRKKPIHFYDTMNYFKASVQKLGSILGLPKMEHPACFGKLPQNQKDYESLSAYCMNDAKISRCFFEQHIISFCNIYGVSLSSTIASLSMKVFRKHFLDKTYYPENQAVHRIIFNAYCGGRVETIRRGTFKNVNCYDFNSLYPSVMVKEYPDPSSAKHVTQSNMYRIQNFEGVSYVEGYQPYTHIPLLPVKTETKLLFPYGTIQGYFTHIELREAIKRGFQCTKIGEGVYYYKTCKPFKTFIETMYNQRKEQKKNNNPMELMTKLCMNSLYGKFAFNYRQSSKCIPKNEVNPDDYIKASKIVEHDNYISFNFDNQQKPPIYSFPIWSCYTTAYARLQLYAYIEQPAIQEKLCYFDTDSLFLKDNMQIPSSDALGDLKHEYFCEEAIFIRPKCYCTIQPKIKGVQSIKTIGDFNTFVKNPTIRENRFIKYRSAINSKEHHKFGTLQINQVIQIKKTISLHDEKRNWNNKRFNHTKEQISMPIYFS